MIIVAKQGGSQPSLTKLPHLLKNLLTIHGYFINADYKFA